MFKKAPNLEIFLQSKLKLDAEEGAGRLGSASGCAIATKQTGGGGGRMKGGRKMMTEERREARRQASNQRAEVTE